MPDTAVKLSGGDKASLKNDSTIETFTRSIVNSIGEVDESEETRAVSRWPEAVYGAIDSRKPSDESVLHLPRWEAIAELDYPSDSLDSSFYNLGVSAANAIERINLEGDNVERIMKKTVLDATAQYLAQSDISAYRNHDGEFVGIPYALNVTEQGFDDLNDGNIEYEKPDWAK